MKRYQKILSLSLFFILIFSLTSCSSNNKVSITEDSYYSKSTSVSNGFGDGLSFDFNHNLSYGSVTAQEAPETELGLTESNTQYNERKIVYKANTNTETKDIERAMEDLCKLIDENNGYIENESRNNWNSFDDVYTRRSASIQIRIPSENFNKFLDSVPNDNLIITSLDRSSTDLSNSYYDKEIRVESLKIQEARLLELLKESSTVDIMLQIENSLTDVRYEIESLTRDLRLIDSEVDYSTIDFYISEVQRYGTPISEPQSFWEELIVRLQDSWENFIDFLKDSLFIFIEVLPFVAILAIIVIVALGFHKKHKLQKRLPHPMTPKPDIKTEDETQQNKNEKK